MLFNESMNCQCNAFLIKGHLFSKHCLNSKQSAIFKPIHKTRSTTLHLLAQPPCPVALPFYHVTSLNYSKNAIIVLLHLLFNASIF